MPRWTEDQLAEYRQRIGQRPRLPGSPPPLGAVPTPMPENLPDADPEHDLQKRIENYLDEHGLYYFHDRSKGKNDPGFLDLVIAAPAGRTIWIELKSKSGRMTKDQKGTKLKLMALEHEVYECKSFRRFLSIMNSGGDRRQNAPQQ